MRRDLTGARVLITGATSGIGRALALALARRETSLLLTGRRADRLADVAAEVVQFGSRAEQLAGDITCPSIRASLVEQARTRLQGLDVLVNNAGVGALGPFASADPARLRRLLEVNFIAPAELIRAALPLLRAGRRPLIVNMASVLAHRAVPNKSEYCASKFALHGFSDALRGELAPAGIDVLVVNPSTTQSEFFEQVLEGGTPPGKGRQGMPADRVAQYTLRAMERGRHELILSAGGRALVWLDRLCPTLADVLVQRFAR
ncbi:MAG: SDR family NAD(P)-dependent oxidoreductase [Pirellulaceae bacterium]